MLKRVIVCLMTLVGLSLPAKASSPERSPSFAGRVKQLRKDVQELGVLDGQKSRRDSATPWLAWGNWGNWGNWSNWNKPWYNFNNWLNY